MEKSNQSFAARLRRAQDMQTILRGYEGFTPPRTEESHEGFERFNESLVQIISLSPTECWNTDLWSASDEMIFTTMQIQSVNYFRH